MSEELKVEDKKMFLNMYYRCKQKEKNLELEINALIGCRILPNQVITGLPGAHENKDLSDLFVLVEKEKKKYIKQRYLATKTAAKIIQCINQLQDETEKSVLIHRHIMCQKWSDVAKAINYSRSSMFDIYNNALEHINVPVARHNN